MKAMTQRLSAIQEKHWFTWLDRRYPKGLRRYTVSRKQLYILPTRSGVAFALLLLVMLLGSINYSNSMGFFLTFLLAGIAHAAALYGHKNLKGIEVTAATKLVAQGTYAATTFAGETAVVTYQLRSTKPHIALTCSVQASEPVVINLTRSVIDRFEADASIMVTPPYRGIYTVQRVRLETRYPLGLFKVWTWLPLTQAILTYPRPEAQPLVVTPVEQEGQSNQSTAGQEDFAGIREYRHGDPLNHIAWKAFARLQMPVVKTFETPTGQQVWLNWTATQGRQEERLSQLCYWVMQSSQANISYGLKLPGLTIEPSAGARHQQQCLAALALYK